MTKTATWLNYATARPSPHCDDRPINSVIELVVIHNISLPPRQFHGNAVESFFMGKLKQEDHPYFASIANLRVSAHFFIRRNGDLMQFVPLERRAWHAGASFWKLRQRAHCNDFSIGIEMEGTDHDPYTHRQYQKLRRVLRSLKQIIPTLHAVTGHCHIAPGRKTDPGDSFDWSALLHINLAIDLGK